MTVKRDHHTLKQTLLKLKGGERYGLGPNSPKNKLAVAFFILNFLDIRGSNEKPAAEVHWDEVQTSHEIISKKRTNTDSSPKNNMEG